MEDATLLIICGNNEVDLVPGQAESLSLQLPTLDNFQRSPHKEQNRK